MPPTTGSVQMYQSHIFKLEYYVLFSAGVRGQVSRGKCGGSCGIIASCIFFGIVQGV
jgi:hypothetical protein